MVKDMLMWDETIFKNQEYFELDFLPEHILHREKQMEALKFSVKPALRGMRPLDAYLLGPPGTGKTSAVLKLFEEIRSVTQKVVPVHVNCKIDSTRYAVFSKIFHAIFGFTPPSSGVSFKKIFSNIAKQLVEKEKVLIVALDDMNYLIYEQEVNDVLYSLLRAHETQPGAKIGVLAISSDLSLNLNSVLDPRVQSIFQAEEIYFPLYTRDEVRDILAYRVKHGFYPGVVSNEVLDKVVDCVMSSADLRVGIDLFKRAGFNAERRASRTISIEDVEKAYEKSRLVHLAYTIKSLKDEEKLLLRILAESRGEFRSGDLYKEFQAKTKLGYTIFYELVNKLDALRLIDVKGASKGERGQTRIITLKYEPEEVLELLKS
ncbi:MAG: ORC1-type DNA replication protein [Methanocellales archaeon]